jgi:hypothetical protein
LYVHEFGFCARFHGQTRFRAFEEVLLEGLLGLLCVFSYAQVKGLKSNITTIKLFKNFETISTDTKSADCIILSRRKFSCQDKKIPLNKENDS